MAKLPRRLRGRLAAICYARFSARVGLKPACPIMKNTAILLIDCPDRPGIVAAVAGFLYQHGANILHADQH